MIELVGFDGDDTLWHSEGFYQDAQAAFRRILAGYVDLTDQAVHTALYAGERRNLRLFGYGAKGMTLSMIETAIAVTGERINAADLHRIVELGKSVLCHPVELLPGIRAAIEQVAVRHRVVLITKGDLFHQEAKIASSGLADLFARIEIVSEKDHAAYTRVLRECSVEPQRFAMVGNSLRSDIGPVLALGGYGVHLPYHVTWAHELEHDVAEEHAHVVRIEAPAQIPAAVESLCALAVQA